MGKGWMFIAVLVLCIGITGCKLQADRARPEGRTERVQDALKILQRAVEAEHDRTIRYQVNSETAIQLGLHGKEEQHHIRFTGEAWIDRQARQLYLAGEMESRLTAEKHRLEAVSLAGKTAAKVDDQPWQVVTKPAPAGLSEDSAALSALVRWIKQGENKGTIPGLTWQDRGEQVVITINYLQGPFQREVHHRLSQVLEPSGSLTPEQRKRLAQEGIQTFTQEMAIDPSSDQIEEIKQELAFSLQEAIVARQALSMKRIATSREAPTFLLPEAIKQQLQ